ncbi:MAG: hypothetical protein ACRD1R_21410, partial [Acidobacteriota bacterium]
GASLGHAGKNGRKIRESSGAANDDATDEAGPEEAGDRWGWGGETLQPCGEGARLSGADCN